MSKGITSNFNGLTPIVAAGLFLFVGAEIAAEFNAIADNLVNNAFYTGLAMTAIGRICQI